MPSKAPMGLPEPRLRPSWTTTDGKRKKGFWRVRIAGEYIPLDDADGNRLDDSATIAQARQAVADLLHRKSDEAKQGADPRIDILLEAYLEDFRRRVSEGLASPSGYETAEDHAYDFQSGYTLSRKGGLRKPGRKLHSGYGALSISELKVHHIKSWINAHKWLSYESRRRAVGDIQAALNLAVSDGRIAFNPIAGFKPEGSSVPRKLFFLPEEIELVREKAYIKNKAWARFFDAMLATAARPIEIARVRPRHYFKSDAGAFWKLSITEWKNGRKTKDERYIPLTPELEQITQDAKDAGRVHVFANSRGRQWAKGAWGKAWRKIRDAVANENDLRPEFSKIVFYDTRGTAITSALDNGADMQAVADAAGTSEVMIRQKYYGKTKERLMNSANALHKATIGKPVLRIKRA